MGTTTTFQELVALFPGPDEKFQASPVAGLSYVRAANPTFVEPTLQVLKAVEAGQTSVVVVSAPGAVGKSTMAAELALKKRALMWDLAKFQVGSKMFSGIIFDAYGNEAMGVQKRFGEGGFFFVFDAMDEAQVRAGSQNFNAFLDDLVEALKEPRPRPTLAILARTDTADWINAVLEEAGVPLARYQIEYFNQPQAFEFIDKQLDARRRKDEKQPLHQQQAKPYAEARRALFSLIYKVFGVPEDGAWVDTRVRDFLGYAPVLEALTHYLDVSNYKHFMQELGEESTDGRDSWQFLTEVLSRLLAREQKKITDAVRGKLEGPAKAAGWADWQHLYEPKEQLGRVLAHALRTPPDVETGLPATIAAPYEDAIRPNMSQHPFLSGTRFANVVFKEFAYAWGLTGASDKLTERLRETMRHREEPFLPSPLFSRFLLKPGEDQTPVVDGQDFGLVYESMLSRAQDVLLSVTQDGDVLQASLGLDPDGDVTLEVELLDSGSGIHFLRRLIKADIDVDVSVRLGFAEQRFVLGPSVDLRCSQLVVSCDDMDVDAHEGVTLRAATYNSASASLRLRVRNESSGRLAVIWPGVAHPWAPYRTKETAGPLRLGETIRGDTLRKLIMVFRRQRSRREDTLHKFRWSQEQIGERDHLLALAQRRDVLERIEAPPRLVLNTDYDSLRELVMGRPDRLSPRAKAFVVEYLGDDEAARIFE